MTITVVSLATMISGALIIIMAPFFLGPRIDVKTILLSTFVFILGAYIVLIGALWMINGSLDYTTMTCADRGGTYLQGECINELEFE